MPKVKQEFEKYPYGTDFSIFGEKYPFSSTEIILLKCYHCCNDDRSKAYRCNNKLCPCWLVKEKYMRKGHTLSEEQLMKLREKLKENKQ